MKLIDIKGIMVLGFVIFLGVLIFVSKAQSSDVLSEAETKFILFVK